MRNSPFDWHNRFLHQARWTKSIRDFFWETKPVSGNISILEVGCGTGAILQDFIKRVAQGESGATLFGLDINAEFLSQATSNAPGANLIQGNGYHLPFPDNTFDVVYCHFLILWVDKPEKMLAEMKRVCQAGGWVAAFAEPDYGARLDYPPQLESIGKLQILSLLNQGANPRIGRKIREFIENTGLSNATTGVLGGEWTSDFDQTAWDNEWSTFVEDVRGLIPAEEIEQLKERELKAWKEKKRILFVPTFYAWGQKPV